MYLLYLDESGNEAEPADRHFVLGGAAVFERTTYYISKEIEELQAKYFPGSPPVEFHASQIRAGKGFWRNVEQGTRQSLLQDIGVVIQNANDPGLVLFAVVIEKTDQLWGERAVEHATAEVCRRFDLFLMRQYQEESERQRGLLIFSQSRYDQRTKLWVRNFRELGTRWGILRNLSDVPYFANSRETRLLQIADFVAHAVFMLYERRDPTLIRSLLSRFDQKNGILHGLVHHQARPASVGCECPCCSSRRKPSNFGTWC